MPHVETPDLANQSWKYACASAQLSTAPLAIDNLPVPIVLYRLSNGKAVAMKDECQHRQLKLSDGYVDQDLLICLYHRWAYNSDGKCVRIAHLSSGKPIPDISTPSFECREEDGCIWVKFPQ